MAHNETEIGTLLRDGDALEAATRLIAVLDEHHGNVCHAALALGVDRATVKRWIQRCEQQGYDVRQSVETMRKDAPEQPRMSSDERAEAAERIGQEREVARAIAWLGKATPKERAAVVAEAGVGAGVVATLLKGGKVTAQGLAVLLVVRKRQARQRRRWRDRRQSRKQA